MRAKQLRSVRAGEVYEHDDDVLLVVDNDTSSVRGVSVFRLLNLLTGDVLEAWHSGRNTTRYIGWERRP